jgi:tetratricopeptide (TPR) repeat protein
MLKDPAAPQPAMLTALCLMDMARWDEALGAARKWKALVSGTPDPDMLIAAIHLNLAQPGEAIKTLQPHVDQLVRTKTTARLENRYLVRLFATAQVQAGQAQQARDLVWPLVENDKSWRADFTILATENVTKANQAVAESWLKLLAAQTDKGDIEGQMILAVAWARLGRRLNSDDARQEAYRVSLAAVDMAGAPADLRARAAVNAGAMLDEINDLGHAEELYRKALLLNPSLHQAANNLAAVLVKLSRLEEAEAQARKAVALSPATATYYDTLAAALKARKKWDEALAAMDKAISREPRNPEWLIGKGELQAAAAAAAGKKPDLSDVRARIEQLRVDFTRLPELKRRYEGLPK